ncbi:hypothetical protein P8R33_00185 [Qipengyuania sp. XHP0211]|uniref:hypothetical protein n=1 Tax=Qipengyuania sp. XHP0211 TaxID=3038079 RepID=UPI00241F04A3|nr:hypothetical protein [Qipengyuania sp. XHP0211]MDG5749524.1 hypothetical protein [Qipengyuania sp. XHP0211]
MKLAIGIAFSCAAFAIPAAADPRESAQLKAENLPLESMFDLAAPDRVDTRRVMQDEPLLPRGTDTRVIAWDPPVVTLPLAKDGPVLTAGAFGKPRKGLPGLAHVAIGWDF